MAVTQVGLPGTTATGTTTSAASTFSGTQTRTAGNLIVFVVTVAATTSVTAINTPSGYTSILNVGNATTVQARTAIFTKVAAGGDGPPTATLTASGTIRWTASLFVLTGVNANTAVDTFGTFGSAHNATISSIAVSTNNGVANTGEFAITSFVREQGTAATTTITNPSGWTNLFADGGTSAIGHNSINYLSNPGGGATTVTASMTSLANTNSAAGIVVFAPVTSAASTLTDDFSTNDLATKWANTFGTVSVSGGQCSVQCDTSFSSALYSTNGYDLTGSSAFVKLTPYTAPSAQITLEASNAGGSQAYDIGYQAGNLISYVQYPAGTYTTIGSTTYNSTSHAYVRIRQSGSTIFFDTAPDGSTWTNQWSRAQDFAITNVVLGCIGGDQGADAPGNAFVDNFNTVPVVAANRIIMSYI